MELNPLSFRAGREQYQKQAEELLAALPRDPEAVRVFRHHHPRFLDPDIVWLPRHVSDAEIRSAALDLAHARLALARWYDFRDWTALTGYVDEVTPDDSPVVRFESAVEAVVGGNATALRALLDTHPDLVRARSSRVTHFDPAVHRATLLHYIAANGVERSRTPVPYRANAVTPPSTTQLAPVT